MNITPIPLVRTTVTLSFIMTSVAAAQQPSADAPKAAPSQPAAALVCARVESTPTLDGKADETAWAKATPLTLTAKRAMEPNKGASTPVTIRTVRTDTHIYFLVEWDDTTESVSHKTWTWNKDAGKYEEGKDREDMCALAFEHTGPFVADMLAGVEGVWDVWHWKAARTNPQGYAMDKTHRYTKSKPEGKANAHKSADGSEIWIARPEDAGDSAEKKQPPPARHKADTVPQFITTTPTGSAAHVQAKGRWANGRWTLELSRRLDTKQADDTAFDPSKSGGYVMSVAVFDQTGDMDKATEVITLSIAK
ncbi:MAG: hypothetical protein KJZ69_18205 [Phycisphaerales bacterium]|nr:hypothetical protein [Phycisphaerales bacterium]